MCIVGEMNASTKQLKSAAPETSGITNRKKPLYLRAPDGQFHADAKGRKIRDDQVSAVAEAVRTWLGTQTRGVSAPEGPMKTEAKYD